jgi:D-glycero-D-manno-heptose 1,7-bisphosphate phosphatase
VPAHLTRPTAALLDRDGTINVKAADDEEYITAVEAFVLLPGAARAVRRLNEAGIAVFVVTNQRGVARGCMTRADLDAIHQAMSRALAAQGARVDGVYACVHDMGECDCRKPLPGLGHRIATDRPDVDLSRAVVVGDAASDVGLAKALGCASVRLGTPTDAPHDGSDAEEPTAWAPDLDAAVTLLLSAEPAGSR